jgi:hypothetical protein
MTLDSPVEFALLACMLMFFGSGRNVAYMLARMRQVTDNAGSHPPYFLELLLMKQASHRRPVWQQRDTWAIFVCLLFLIEQPVYAYVDPGSGSMIWQVLVAGFVGLLFYWRRFWSFFSIRRRGHKY